MLMSVEDSCDEIPDMPWTMAMSCPMLEEALHDERSVEARIAPGVDLMGAGEIRDPVDPATEELHMELETTVLMVVSAENNSDAKVDHHGNR